MNYDEFGTIIKDKYPQYKDVDNMELTRKVIEKYPQYASQVEFEQEKNLGEIAKEKYKQGTQVIERGALGVKEMFGFSSEKDKQRQKELDTQSAGEDYKRNLGTRAIGSTAEQVGVLQNMGIVSATGALAGAGVGFVVGGPAGAAIGAERGSKIGAFAASYTAEAGNFYTELINEKDLETGKNLIPENYAKTAANIDGVLVGLMDTYSISQIAKVFGVDLKKEIVKNAVKKATVDLVKQGGGAVAKETGTEIFQEIISMSTAEIAKSLSGGNYDKLTVENFTNRLKDTAIDTVLSMGLLTGGGLAAKTSATMVAKGMDKKEADTKSQVMTPIETKKFMEENADLYLQQVEQENLSIKNEGIIPQEMRMITPKAGETKQLTYAADVIIPQISKKLGVKLVVTSRYRENKAYKSEHTQGIAMDVSTSELSPQKRIEAAREILADPHYKYLSTSDPAVLKAFKGNPKLRDFRNIDATLGKKQGFNHLDHFHLTVNKDVDVKGQTMALEMGGAVKDSNEVAMLVSDVTEKIKSRKKELYADLGGELSSENILNEVEKKVENVPEDIEAIKASKGYLTQIVNNSQWAKDNNKNYTDANIMKFVNSEKFQKEFIKNNLGDPISIAPEMITDEFLGGVITEDMTASDVYEALKSKTEQQVIQDDFKTVDKQYYELKSRFDRAKSIQEKDATTMAFFDWLANVPEELQSNYVNDMNLSEYYDAGKPYTVRMSKNNVETALKAFKKGFREGVKVTKENVKDVQNAVIDFLDKSGLPKADKADFLNTIKNIQTVEQLEKALPKIEERIEAISLKIEKRQLRKQIKNIVEVKSTIKQSGVRKGKFDYETTKVMEEVKNISKMTQETAQNKLIELQIEGIENPTFTDKLINKMYSYQAQGSKSDITLLKSLLSDLRKIQKEGKDAKNEEEFFKSIQKQKIVDEVVQKVDGYQGFGKLKQMYLENIGSINSIMREIFGDKLAEKFNVIADEVNFRNAIAKTIRDFDNKAMEIFGINKSYDLALIYQDMKELRNDLTLNIDGRFKKLSTFDVMDIYNSIKNEDIAKDYYDNYTEEVVWDLVNQLTNEQMEFADNLVPVVQSYEQIMNNYNIKQYGIEMAKRANYWPATSDFEKEYNGLQTYIPMSSIPSSLKQKVKGVKPLPKNAYEKMRKHVKQGEWINHMADNYNMATAVFKDKNFMIAMNEGFGDSTIPNLFNKHLEEISLAPTMEEKSTYGAFIEKIIGNWAAAKIASIPVFVKQLMSVSTYSTVTPDWGNQFLKGLSNAKETMDFMLKELPYLNERFQSGHDELIAEALKSAEGVSKYRNDVIKAATYLTRKGDLFSLVYGGFPYYKHLLESGFSKEEAQRKFILQTETTMQGKTSSNMSALQKDRAWNFFMRFKNTPFQFSRIIFDSYSAYKRGDISQEQWQGILYQYTVVQPVLFALAGDVFVEGSKALMESIKDNSKDDDEEEENKKQTKELKMFFDALNQIIVTPVDAVPFLGDALNFGLRRLEGQQTYDLFQAQGMSEIAKELESLSSSIDKGNIAGMFYHFAVMSEAFHGLPVKNIIRGIDPWTGGKIKEAVSNRKKKSDEE